MSRICLSDNVNKLGIEKDVVRVLKKYNILTIENLWKLNRNDLKKMRLSAADIKHIKIKMQLQSIDLNGKKYNKN